MRERLSAAIGAAIVLGVGVLTLLGLLVGDDMGLLTGVVRGLAIDRIAGFFLQLVVVVAAVLVLVGVFNLLAVHINRIRRRGGGIYSIVLVLSFLAAILTYLFQRETSMILLEDVQVSIESALAGLLFFALVYGAYRALRRRMTWAGLLFIVVILVVLLGALPLVQSGLLDDVNRWLMTVPVSAGARGILLGIALATVVAGVRVLIGQDRSYRE